MAQLLGQLGVLSLASQLEGTPLSQFPVSQPHAVLSVAEICTSCASHLGGETFRSARGAIGGYFPLDRMEIQQEVGRNPKGSSGQGGWSTPRWTSGLSQHPCPHWASLPASWAQPIDAS